MWIRRREYDRLKLCEKLKKKLEEEVSYLADQISAQVKDCKIGPWCKDCGHIGHSRSRATHFGGLLETRYAEEIAGEVVYCKKHLHGLCPEYEMRK